MEGRLDKGKPADRDDAIFGGTSANLQQTTAFFAMDTETRTLRTVFSEAESRRKQLDNFTSSTSSAFQQTLVAAIKDYDECLRIAAQVSLFSPNETLDDINTGDLQFLLINYYLAELILKKTATGRKESLLQARSHYERFLKLLDNYDILSKLDSKIFERYTEDPDNFSTAPVTDAAARRGTKIARFKAEKELKSRIEVIRIRHEARSVTAHDSQYMQRLSTDIDNDLEVLRELQLENITLCIHKTFDTLESIAQELRLVELAPPVFAGEPPADQYGRPDTYSERLDGPLTQRAGRGGPILDPSGKPLQPFTLLDKRTQLQQGVFRPDHNLPTMTIDEYLAEERRRGGIIEGGGPQSGVREEVDEDDMDKADEETMKARAWDDFKEANPKGSGNTLNRG